jgi:hypothetical protein
MTYVETANNEATGKRPAPTHQPSNQEDPADNLPPESANNLAGKLDSGLIISRTALLHQRLVEDYLYIGRIGERLAFWNKATQDPRVLEVVRQGYALPFLQIPESFNLRNNQSAISQSGFVEGSIQSLQRSGAVSETSSQGLCINPLTVANNGDKMRLVLDCSYLNQHLAKFKFKLDDFTNVIDYFSEGCWMSKFDLKAGYHQVAVKEEHRQYLGFAWNWSGTQRYYRFNALPFGLSTAPYIFTKVLRPLVRRWRKNGLRVVLYLDDCIVIGPDCAKATEDTARVLRDVSDAGLVINIEKSQLFPVQNLEFLGFELRSEGHVIALPELKRRKIRQKVLSMHRGARRCTPRKVLELAGSIISIRHVIGDVSVLRTRSMYGVVGTTRTWDQEIQVDGIIADLEFWADILDAPLSRSLRQAEEARVEVQSDASATGSAAVFKLQTGRQVVVVREWTLEESQRSSTWRELKIVAYALAAVERTTISRQTVWWETDNQAVAVLVRKGSMKPDLQKLAVEIYEITKKLRIVLKVKWIPRAMNEIADQWSRYRDWDDWSISRGLFRCLNEEWKQCTIDAFANDRNAQLTRFYSLFPVPGSCGIDALKQSWNGECVWAVPPFRLISKVILHFAAQAAEMIIFVPAWPSARFWPFLVRHRDFGINLIHWRLINEAGRFLVPGVGKARPFMDHKNLTMLALHFSSQGPQCVRSVKDSQ